MRVSHFNIVRAVSIDYISVSLESNDLYCFSIIKQRVRWRPEKNQRPKYLGINLK